MTRGAAGIVESVQAWEALDSRGRPTVAARVTLGDGAQGVALVPSGASTGSHEAVELRDRDARYGGLGVHQAVANAAALGDRLRGIAVGDVDELLATVDPSPVFAGVGANAVLAVSLAAARSDAASQGISLARRLAGEDGPLLLPMPMVNVLSGGAHAGAVLDVQDFLVVPVGATCFAEAIEWAAAVREAAGRLAFDRGFPQAMLVADEGGVGIPLRANADALGLLTDAIEAAGFAAGSQVAIAVDVAATQLYRSGSYHLATEDRDLTADGLVAELSDWCDRFPIVSLEDVLAEDDWAAWRAATEALGDRVQLLGDDLFVTQRDRLQRGIDEAVANAILIKVNQNGLVSGTSQVVELARSAGYRTVVSARSGDTEDSWLADLAVGWRAGQIKVGSTHRSERTAKWNRLLELEATEHTTFAGNECFAGKEGT